MRFFLFKFVGQSLHASRSVGSTSRVSSLADKKVLFFLHPLFLLICLSDLTVCGICGSLHRNRKLGYAYVVKLKFMVKYA